MASLKSLLIAGIGLPVLGGCGYASYAFMQPTNLKEDLMKHGHKPLSTEKDQDKEEWTKLIKAYWKTKGVPKIGNLTVPEPEKTQPKDENIVELQNECKSLFEKKKNKDRNYEKDFELAKNWCVKDSVKIDKPSSS